MKRELGTFLYLDTETTGLGPKDQVTEVAWCVSGDSFLPRQFFMHHHQLPNEWVINNTDYVTRVFPGEKSTKSEIYHTLASDVAFLKERYQTTVIHLVGACPGFDDRMLRRSLFEPLSIDEPPWSHRLVDIELVIATYFYQEMPLSLKESRQLLGMEGENPAPHTALADAKEVRDMHTAILTKLSNHNVRYSASQQAQNNSMNRAEEIITRMRGAEFTYKDSLNVINYLIQRTRLD
jgi:hypothetical protein